MIRFIGLKVVLLYKSSRDSPHSSRWRFMFLHSSLEANWDVTTHTYPVFSINDLCSTLILGLCRNYVSNRWLHFWGLCCLCFEFTLSMQILKIRSFYFAWPCLVRSLRQKVHPKNICTDIHFNIWNHGGLFLHLPVSFLVLWFAFQLSLFLNRSYLWNSVTLPSKTEPWRVPTWNHLQEVWEKLLLLEVCTLAPEKGQGPHYKLVISSSMHIYVHLFTSI